MNSAEQNKLHWTSNSLLSGKKQNTDFVRTAWDASKEHDFGAWNPKSDSKSKAPAFQSSHPKPAQIDSETDSIDRLFDSPNGTHSDAAEISASDHASAAPAEPASPAPHPPEAGPLTAPVELNEQQIRIARQQGYVQGLKDGMAKTLLDLESERSKERDLIQTITSELQSLQNDSFRLFEPLRKLALHIAEQLVRGELSLSGEAIERLVKACVADLTSQENGITLSANPHDLDRVRPLLKNSDPPLLFHADHSLLPGSIRVRANDTVIEDLIETRLEDLARKLIFEPEIWLKNASKLAGVEVETLEPAWTDLKKKVTEHSIDDVVENNPSNATQDTYPATPPTSAASPSDVGQAYL